MEKSRRSCEQTFILVSHYVSYVSRKARFDTGVLKQLELLSLKILFKNSITFVKAIETLALKFNMRHPFEVGGAACQLVFVQVRLRAFSLFSVVATKYSLWEVVARLIGLKLLESGQTHLLGHLSLQARQSHAILRYTLSNHLLVRASRRHILVRKVVHAISLATFFGFAVRHR